VSLTPGASLAHYTLAEKIGEGGMGVVWRAHDTTLGRDVAIKVLPEAFAADAERLARFEREARLLASLNHPHIAAVYGFHAERGVRFLAMELAEGESLAERLRRGPVPVAEAITTARQLADALEAAHERGIIHRDLKPGNVMLAPGGTVKVLDFGLAKALEGDRGPASNPNLSQSPTITAAMTSAHVILGTAAYMSPEQARGQAADKRADVWAFGVIVFEMLTGRQLFTGDTVSDTLAGVLRADPDWHALPQETPARVRRLIERCLTRDVRQRLRDIGEARIALDSLSSGGADPVTPAGAAAAGKSSPLRPLLFGAGGVALGVLAMIALGTFGPRPDRLPLRRFVIATPDSASSAPREPVISPDGDAVAYIAGSTLWLRELDAVEPRALETMNGIAHPFWSPDSRQIGFISGSRVMKVDVRGGEAQLVSDVRKPFTNGSGACWRDDDIIVASRAEDDGVFAIPARGGDPRQVLATDTTAEGDFHEPSALPGSRGVVYVVHRKQGVDTIELFAGGKRRVLLRLEGQSIRHPRYSATGHILFYRSPQNTGVWALPFDINRMRVTGEPFLVSAGDTYPSISRDGTLVMQTGRGASLRQLEWVDRQGNVLSTIGDPEEGLDLLTGPALSPDGRRVVISQSGEGDEADLWIYDTARGTKTRLTFERGNEQYPTWTPDASRIVYVGSETSCASPDCFHLLVRSADGTGTPDTIATAFHALVGPDGRTIVCTIGGRGLVDLATVPLEHAGTVRSVGPEDEVQLAGPVSPDGRFVAYTSFESGRSEVYLRRFPSWGGKWQVSVSGGNCPRWNGTGDRLFYVHGDEFYEVEVSGQDSPVLGRPHRLFTLTPSGRTWRDLSAYFDVTKDGQRFVIVRPVGGPVTGANVIAVQNWIAEFRGEKKR